MVSYKAICEGKVHLVVIYLDQQGFKKNKI